MARLEIEEGSFQCGDSEIQFTLWFPDWRAEIHGIIKLEGRECEISREYTVSVRAVRDGAEEKDIWRCRSTSISLAGTDEPVLVEGYNDNVKYRNDNYVTLSKTKPAKVRNIVRQIHEGWIKLAEELNFIALFYQSRVESLIFRHESAVGAFTLLASEHKKRQTAAEEVLRSTDIVGEFQKYAEFIGTTSMFDIARAIGQPLGQVASEYEGAE